MSKEEWVAIHGERPHHWKFNDLGWSWTPVRCQCSEAHVLDTSEHTVKARR